MIRRLNPDFNPFVVVVLVQGFSCSKEVKNPSYLADFPFLGIFLFVELYTI